MCNTKLNVAEDEIGVKINGVLVVFGGFTELSTNEVKLRTMVVDVRVVRILNDSFRKVFGSGVSVTCDSVSSVQQLCSREGSHTKLKRHACPLDIALCHL